MTDEAGRLQFRLQNIIPRSLSTPKVAGPEEVEFQMTWGKVAGTKVYIYKHFARNWLFK